VRATGGHISPTRPERAPGFRTGLLSNLLNPEVGLFFLHTLRLPAPRRRPGHAAIVRES